ncbi:hypothetical protein K470DRAFT_258126 [Piedraia hortae CBS 480.64]|uniref:DUF4045 domain-containing protein n=1 Tax=Piedraia hortae CBS 480.64 TaxID=1314780 RepID=A0A6A7BXR5_9PEZI|nr:hypothetical protein K470DRAFT_258126 [Piedraia hortae CBS 480.64]
MVFVDTPAPPASPDDDPSAFLQSIRELTEKRDREDEERFRKLEEEVKKSREERAARRAGRPQCRDPWKFMLTTRQSEHDLSRLTSLMSLCFLVCTLLLI